VPHRSSLDPVHLSKTPHTIPTAATTHTNPSTHAKQLCAAHPALLPALISLLAPVDTQLAAGADRVQLLATEVLSELLGPGTFGTDAQQERATLEVALGALVGLKEAALAPGDSGAAAARSVAAVASAAAERDAELICGGAGSGVALPLAELMLQCMQRREREVRGRGVAFCGGGIVGRRPGHEKQGVLKQHAIYILTPNT